MEHLFPFKKLVLSVEVFGERKKGPQHRQMLIVQYEKKNFCLNY